MSEDKSKLQLIGEIAQANNKNLELIEELNNREDEIEQLRLELSGYRQAILQDKEMLGLKQEIERLNNIINEFDKFLFGELQIYGGGGTVQEYYDKLQELKGSDK